MTDATPKPLQQPHSLPARVALPEDRTSALREKAAQTAALNLLDDPAWLALMFC